MGYYYYSCLPVLAMFLVVSLAMEGSFACDLPPNFYEKTCPCLFSTVKDVVRSAISKEARMGASLVRLFFHDCFVNGCDGSLLLDDTATLIGEKTAPPNNNSVRGFEVIDAIKAKVEEVCPGVVSCADILAIAARDSTEILGGPSWIVRLGRRDARTANFSAALSNLPPPFLDLAALISRFQSKGLSATDMVALSGSHTIGLSRCIGFRDHIYNDSNIDPSFAALRRSNCPRADGSGDLNLAPLDARTPTLFDNAYFINLVERKGLLHSDQELFNGGSTDALVLRYSRDRAAFFSDFAKAMIKMGDLSPLTGSQGEIRKNCRRVN